MNSTQQQLDVRLGQIHERLAEINDGLGALDAVPENTWRIHPDLQEEYNQLVKEQYELYAEVNEIETIYWRLPKGAH